jgi:hypothetical protein
MSNFLPTTKEAIVLASGETVSVPKCTVSFKAWKGVPLENTYGGKQIIDIDGQPFFAELATLRMLEKEGWSGVWVDSYRKALRKEMPPSQVQYPAIAQTASEIFNMFSEQMIKGGGCWDVLAWKGKEVLFVECKRNKKDSMQQSQILWLERCLQMGLKPENFLIVEWEIQ